VWLLQHWQSTCRAVSGKTVCLYAQLSFGPGIMLYINQQGTIILANTTGASWLSLIGGTAVLARGCGARRDCSNITSFLTLQFWQLPVVHIHSKEK